MQIVVLAAGRGTRLQPLTLQRSKAMIPVLGKPMVARVLETLVSDCTTRHDHNSPTNRSVIIVTSDHDDEIRTYFDRPNKPQPPGDLTNMHENEADRLSPVFVTQKHRLGMGHALQCASPHLAGHFILSACDNLTTTQHVCELVTTHHQNRAMATLSLMEVDREMVSRTGIVQMDGARIIRIVEKPALDQAPSNIASLPLYVFSQEFLRYLPRIKPSQRGEYELQDAIQMAIDDGEGVYGVHTSTRHQITNAADLLALNMHLLTHSCDPVRLEPAHVGQNTHLITPLYIEAGTQIGEGCVIGPRVYIEHGSTVGSYTHIKDAIILRNGVVGDGQTVMNQVVSSD